jgi:hypothetical protein
MATQNGSSLSTREGLGWASEDVFWLLSRPRDQLSPRVLMLRPIHTPDRRQGYAGVMSRFFGWPFRRRVSGDR